MHSSGGATRVRSRDSSRPRCGHHQRRVVLAARIARMRRILDFLNQLDDDRGDVPGWVLITLMTAGLVILIWALAGPALQGVFQQAIDRVTGF